MGLVVSAMLSHRDSVNAPCYTDIHAVNSDNCDVFMSLQMRDQLKKPEKQAELLKTG